MLAARTNTDRSAVARTYAVMIEEGRVIPRRAEVPLGGLEAMLRSMIELGDLPGPTASPSRYIDLSIVQDAQQ